MALPSSQLRSLVKRYIAVSTASSAGAIIDLACLPLIRTGQRYANRNSAAPLASSDAHD